MRKLLQWLLTKPIMWLNNTMASAPGREAVFESLSLLHKNSQDKKNKQVLVLPVSLESAKIIIFSDQHKGNGTWADDFKACSKNYCAALNQYNSQGYTLINMGDSEELWKFRMNDIVKVHHETFVAEAAFHPNRYIKTFGNHDITWKNKLDVSMHFKDYFKMPLPVYEGIVLRHQHKKTNLDILLTHGHQGDRMSDNNALSTWLVAHIWMPVQRYLRINPNSPRTDFNLRNQHNKMMYEWSAAQKNLLLITGHTHQPVFASGKYFNHPSNNIPTGLPGEAHKPTYFNSGCCCLNDGDITGIEIADGFIRLIKWYDEEIQSKRKVLEEIPFALLLKDLGIDE